MFTAVVRVDNNSVAALDRVGTGGVGSGIISRPPLPATSATMETRATAEITETNWKFGKKQISSIITIHNICQSTR